MITSTALSTSSGRMPVSLRLVPRDVTPLGFRPSSTAPAPLVHVSFTRRLGTRRALGLHPRSTPRRPLDFGRPSISHGTRPEKGASVLYTATSAGSRIYILFTYLLRHTGPFGITIGLWLCAKERRVRTRISLFP